MGTEKRASRQNMMIRKMSQIIIRKFRWIHDSTKEKNSQIIRKILEKHVAENKARSDTQN